MIILLCNILSTGTGLGDVREQTPPALARCEFVAMVQKEQHTRGAREGDTSYRAAVEKRAFSAASADAYLNGRGLFYSQYFVRILCGVARHGGKENTVSCELRAD